jgi:hypothetical protein
MDNPFIDIDIDININGISRLSPNRAFFVLVLRHFYQWHKKYHPSTTAHSPILERGLPPLPYTFNITLVHKEKMARIHPPQKGLFNPRSVKSMDTCVASSEGTGLDAFIQTDTDRN